MIAGQGAFDRGRLPPARTFYERELGKLTRPSRGWSRGRCPFHKSKSGTSFSVNLENGGFHCFGCGVHGGDVLAFVMLRDHLNFKAAAQSLGAWQDVTPAERLQLDVAKAKREREREEAAAAKELERRQRLAIRDEVHTDARIWKEAAQRLSELRRGATPISEGEEEACWAVMSLAFKDLHDAEAEYCAAAGVEYTE
ncbi:MAG: CHC2 zinc finger domain-containing protein [Terriglobales bacterium]